eukprot:6456648-Amphidinium_carterae.4
MPAAVQHFNGIGFQTNRVHVAGIPPKKPVPMPLVIWLSGLSSTHSSRDDYLESFCQKNGHGQGDFLLLFPIRPCDHWWFVDNDKHLGWLEGNLNSDLVLKMHDLFDLAANHSLVDPEKVFLFGWSAGGYALTEMLAHKRSLPARAMVIGGFHGHGNTQDEVQAFGVPVTMQSRFPAFEMKWQAYLARLASPPQHHVPKIVAVHNMYDAQSSWKPAQTILDVIDATRLGAAVPLVERIALTLTPNRNKNKTGHSYSKSAIDALYKLMCDVATEMPTTQEAYAQNHSRRLAKKNHPSELILRRMMHLMRGSVVQILPDELAYEHYHRCRREPRGCPQMGMIPACAMESEVVKEGRQFYAFIEDRARGFSLEEATNAREKCDYELSVYRRADARRQQEHFSHLQQSLKSSNEEELAQARQSMRSQYQQEFRTELDSVRKELNMFQKASAENASEQVVALQDELLCAEQRSSLSEQRYLSQIGEMNDWAQRQQNLNNQLELRMEQVTSMSRTTVAELQQELVNAESYNTPDFGVDALSLPSSKPLFYSVTPGHDAGSSSAIGTPPGLG